MISARQIHRIIEVLCLWQCVFDLVVICIFLLSVACRRTFCWRGVTGSLPTDY